MLDARKLTRIQGEDPDSLIAVKARFLLSKKKYFSKLTYG